MKTYAYGFPKLIEDRKFKKSLESFWSQKISEKQLFADLKEIERNIQNIYEKYVDFYPVGEFSYYDNMLDMALMLGVYDYKNIDNYFSLCRGKDALEMTKWFNTNYHYLVPIISKDTEFYIKWRKESLVESGNRIPYFIGPFTFLKLSKGYNKSDFEILLEKLLKPYKELISNFKRVHFDEPAFVMDLTEDEVKAIESFYKKLCEVGTEIYLFTYYDSVDFLSVLVNLPIKAIGLDFIYGKDNLEYIKKNGFPDNKILIAGIVDGRNVWRSDIKEKVEFLKELSHYAENIIISNASPLYHLPVSIKNEDGLNKNLLNMLSFAEERLYELKLIKDVFDGNINIKEVDWFHRSEFERDEKVQERVKSLKEQDFIKEVSYSERKKLHKDILKLPLFPTTTIGSFPQTDEIRKKRSLYKKGEISESEYKDFIRREIKKLIEFQEEEELDVLVHGEFERTDMVEFFAEKLNGIAVTKNGWIISYGTRCYRPPIIYGDISRPQPMTIEEISYAQSLTNKPVKGILTGPVTILAWSYLRNDISIDNIAFQLALCLRDEINDLIKNGIKIVQIDEPAFREKAPIKKRHWASYFNWAVKSFRLASNVDPKIQIHTHMCYSEFSEIIEYILQMDFDVISIEASRSRADIIEAFERINFDRQIGLGVWDVHSPVVPKLEDMEKVVERALKVLPKENFWINPDCGLKTRKWEEVIPSIRNLVKLAKKLRKSKNM